MRPARTRPQKTCCSHNAEKYLMYLCAFVVYLLVPLTVQGFPSTAITSRTSTSVYATSKNAFYVSDPSMAGQCTWYSYGRVIELAEGGSLSASVTTQFENAFWETSNRHAKNWPSFLGGTWYDTNSAALPVDKRRAGLIAVWKGGDYGHVGFVEEVSADKAMYRLTDFNRNRQEAFKDAWYSFAGTSGLHSGGYPFFFELSVPSASGFSAVSSGVTVSPAPVLVNQKPCP